MRTLTIKVKNFLDIHDTSKYRIEPFEVSVGDQTVRGWYVWELIEGDWTKLIGFRD